MNMPRAVHVRLSRVGAALLSIVALATFAIVPAVASADDTNVLAPNLVAYNGFDNISSTAVTNGNLNVYNADNTWYANNKDYSRFGGDKFDDAWKGDNANMKYTSTNNHSGGNGTNIHLWSTSGTNGSAGVGWNSDTLNPAGVNAAYWSSMNIYLSETPDADDAITLINVKDMSGDVIGSLRIRGGAPNSGTDTIAACDDQSPAVCGVPSNKVKLTTGNWYRVVVGVNPSLNIVAKVYADTTSTTAIDTSSTPVHGAHAAVGSVDFGLIYYGGVNGGKKFGDFWISKLLVSDTGIPSPYSLPGGSGSFTVNENFNKGTTGDFNVHSDDYKFSPTTQGASGNNTPPCATNSVFSDGGTFSFCTRTYNSQTQSSFARMTQAVFGANKRSATLTFDYKYTGTCPTGGGGTSCTVDQPILTVYNTDRQRWAGGGNFNMWIVHGNGHLRGDLQHTECFDSGTALNLATTHHFVVNVNYRSDYTSSVKVTMDGTVIGARNSTTTHDNGFDHDTVNDNDGYDSADRLESVLLGPSAQYVAGLQALYDGVSLTTSPTTTGAVTEVNNPGNCN